MALLEKGETYRDIASKAGVSPNTIKAIANKSGLDETTSISSRAFELYVQQKTPIEIAIELNLEAKEAIRYHQEYLILLGLTEFTKVYIQIKDNPWPYVNLTRLVHSARMGDGEVVELLKIANGHLPRVRLEYDGVIMEINSRKAELSSWKAATSNEVRLYQDFCNRNLKLKNREDELKLSINELEFKEADLQKKITNLNQHLSELDLSEREIDAENEHPDSGMEQEGDRLMDELSVIPPSNMTNDNHQDENKIGFYQSQVEPSSGTLIFDTKNLLLACSLFQEQQE